MEKINNYNSSLSDFYSEAENYLNKSNSLLSQQNKAIKIELRLSNSGNLPANDIDINIQVPENWVILKELADGLTKPKIPINPISDILGYTKHFFDTNLVSNLFNDPIITPNLELSKNSYRIIDDKEIQFHFKKIKHVEVLFLEHFYIVSEKANIPSISINYKVNADEVPDAINGELSFAFKIKGVNAPSNRNEKLIKHLTTE